MATMEQLRPKSAVTTPVLRRGVRMSVSEFNQWLGNLDSNGDGVISKKELEKGIRALGLWFPGWKAKQAFAAADSNDNGLIDTDDELHELIEIAKTHWGVDIYDE